MQGVLHSHRVPCAMELIKVADAIFLGIAYNDFALIKHKSFNYASKIDGLF